MKTFYITTTLPYVNAEPHVGFAMEFIRADAIARYKKLLGYEVFFNTGTDEHGQKLFEAAKKEGVDVQVYVNGYAEKFRGLTELLGVTGGVHFIRTTDENHVLAAQAFWKKCDENGFIYKKNYQAKYCVGCESQKTDSELVDGKCSIHPQLDIQIIEEENYFFKYSAFQERLLDFYKQNQNFILPEFRFNEIRTFVERGLEDFPISRLKEKMSWGIPVPGDDSQVMYVWFDALVNYVSTLGWPNENGDFEKYWVNGAPVQYCGKDNTRFQGAMWQAMLMSVDLPNSNKIIVNGFITGEGGVKMSKSLGNVINPYDVVSEYGTDALRYFLLREVSSFEDSPFTMDRFKDAYNAGLANGIGNLTSRIMKMATTNIEQPISVEFLPYDEKFLSHMDSFDIQKAADVVFAWVGELDKQIQTTEPFKLVKTDPEKGKAIIVELVKKLAYISQHLEPLLPETSKKIIDLIVKHQTPTEPLFVRKD